MNGPFEAEQSRGTKSPYWRLNDALGHVKESHKIWIFFVQHVPVRHLLSSMAILYHVIAQLLKAHLWLSWIEFTITLNLEDCVSEFVVAEKTRK